MQAKQTPLRIGVDTGGTFTDFALYKDNVLITHKVLSTANAPEQAILQGIDELGLTEQCQAGKLLVIHGSTVATNAALENKGAKTLFVTNKGLEDILTIGRQNRPDIYDLTPIKHAPPVPSNLCSGVSGRMDYQGEEIQPLDADDMAQLISKINTEKPISIAVCLLFSYLNPEHENRIKEAIGIDYFVSASNEVLPEIGEYERGIATWLNATLSPLMQSYLSRLTKAIPQGNLSVMQSSGGTIASEQAAEKAINLLLSGPAGGLAAALSIKQEVQCEGLLTFDMGGTSSDVALIKDNIQLTNSGSIGRYPVAVPMVDMHTIGAGGGSIAYLDAAKMLHVGPESAGANPGPACYGLGAKQATVTDAHMLLGNLQAAQFGAGKVNLDPSASAYVIDALAESVGIAAETMALGILDLANEHMAAALRKISAQRGEDPKEYRLCSFGGAGGLHVCALAEKLGMHKAIIPKNSGILSALGMLVAPGKRELAQVIQIEKPANYKAESTDESIDDLLVKANQLAKQGKSELLQEGYNHSKIGTDFSLDCRYSGQSSSLSVPLLSNSSYESLIHSFHKIHEKNFGYRLEKNVELVTLRAHLHAANEKIETSCLPVHKGHQSQIEDFTLVDRYQTEEATESKEQKGEYRATPCYNRKNLVAGQTIQGPALITEKSATSWIAAHWTAVVHEKGHLLLDRA